MEGGVAVQLALDTQPPPDGRETMRWWEAGSLCVVLGRGCKAEADVDIEACEIDGIPIVRRESGGGTVLLGPGCLNFSLALRIDHRAGLENVAASYSILLGAVAAVLDVHGLRVEGSDLALDGCKVSGNAQRRTQGWLLHHGTLLYGMDLDLMGRYLREPARRPAYRGVRTHAGFLTNLPLSRDRIEQRLTRISSRLALETPAGDPRY